MPGTEPRCALCACEREQHRDTGLTAGVTLPQTFSVSSFQYGYFLYVSVGACDPYVSIYMIDVVIIYIYIYKFTLVSRNHSHSHQLRFLSFSEDQATVSVHTVWV